MLTVGLHGVPDPAGLGRAHDHGVAIMRDGHVLFSMELERHTGRKHDGELGRHVEDLLAPWLRGGEEIRFVLVNSFLGAGFRSNGGMLSITGVPDLPIPRVIAPCEGRLRQSSGTKARFYSMCHEMAHVGTCLPFFGAFRPGSLLVHIDGGASRSCASAWHFDGKAIECLDHGWHPGLKGAVNNFNTSLLAQRILGADRADHLGMPGKLMGLAGLAEPDRNLMEWLAQRDWLRDEPLDTDDMREAVQQGFPRLPFAAFSPRDQGCQVLAACMQRHLENEVLEYVRRHKQIIGARHLYYSGGAALNVHANARIESELGFDSVMIPPAPSDAGLALGAAAFLEWSSGCPIGQRGPFLNSVPPRAADAVHAQAPIVRSAEEAAGAIARGDIIGVWVGDAELGPRALGHRSILLRPDSVPLRRRASEVMKQREWYRPLAPMMLADVALEALEGYQPGSFLGRYMLGAWKVRPAWRDALRGCIHADGTVRAQVVTLEDMEMDHIRQLLTHLRGGHGICGVINTSFNTRGVPIVHSLADACARSDELQLDTLWLPALEAAPRTTPDNWNGGPRESEGSLGTSLARSASAGGGALQ